MAKVLVSMPDDLLDRIDREAQRRRTSRSALLQEAARRELGSPDADAIDAALRRGRTALASIDAFESADVVRAGREERDARDRDR